MNPQPRPPWGGGRTNGHGQTPPPPPPPPPPMTSHNSHHRHSHNASMIPTMNGQDGYNNNGVFLDRQAPALFRQRQAQYLGGANATAVPPPPPPLMTAEDSFGNVSHRPSQQQQQQQQQQKDWSNRTSTTNSPVDRFHSIPTFPPPPPPPPPTTRSPHNQSYDAVLMSAGNASQPFPHTSATATRTTHVEQNYTRIPLSSLMDMVHKRDNSRTLYPLTSSDTNSVPPPPPPPPPPPLVVPYPPPTHGIAKRSSTSPVPNLSHSLGPGPTQKRPHRQNVPGHRLVPQQSRKKRKLSQPNKRGNGTAADEDSTVKLVTLTGAEANVASTAARASTLSTATTTSIEPTSVKALPGPKLNRNDETTRVSTTTSTTRLLDKVENQPSLHPPPPTTGTKVPPATLQSRKESTVTKSIDWATTSEQESMTTNQDKTADQTHIEQQLQPQKQEKRQRRKCRQVARRERKKRIKAAKKLATLQIKTVKSVTTESTYEQVQIQANGDSDDHRSSDEDKVHAKGHPDEDEEVSTVAQDVSKPPHAAPASRSQKAVEKARARLERAKLKKLKTEMQLRLEKAASLASSEDASVGSDTEKNSTLSVPTNSKAQEARDKLEAARNKLRGAIKKRERASRSTATTPKLAPISALSSSLIVKNIASTGRPDKVFFQSSMTEENLGRKRLEEFLGKQIIQSLHSKMEPDATIESPLEGNDPASLADRKLQLQRELVALKEKLERSQKKADMSKGTRSDDDMEEEDRSVSSRNNDRSGASSTNWAAGLTKEDLEKRKTEAQVTMDISYWKHFVSKQEQILENVVQKGEENQRALEQCQLERHETNKKLLHAQHEIDDIESRRRIVKDGISTSMNALLKARQALYDAKKQLLEGSVSLEIADQLETR